MRQGGFVSYVLLAALGMPNLAWAESLAAPAYFTMGSGLLVLFGLAAYVIRQLRNVVRQYSKEPAK